MAKSLCEHSTIAALESNLANTCYLRHFSCMLCKYPIRHWLTLRTFFIKAMAINFHESDMVGFKKEAVMGAWLDFCFCSLPLVYFQAKFLFYSKFNICMYLVKVLSVVSVITGQYRCSLNFSSMSVKFFMNGTFVSLGFLCI